MLVTVRMIASVTSASDGCHSSFIRHSNACYPPSVVFYLRPFILTIRSALLFHKCILMHFDRISKTMKLGPGRLLVD